jgi:hypothetical protein
MGHRKLRWKGILSVVWTNKLLFCAITRIGHDVQLQLYCFPFLLSCFNIFAFTASICFHCLHFTSFVCIHCFHCFHCIYRFLLLSLFKFHFFYLHSLLLLDFTTSGCFHYFHLLLLILFAFTASVCYYCFCLQPSF